MKSVLKSVNKLFIPKNSLILPTMENPGCQIFSTIRNMLSSVVPGVTQNLLQYTTNF